MEKFLAIDLCATCPRQEECPGSYSKDRLCDCDLGGYIFVEVPDVSEFAD